MSKATNIYKLPDSKVTPNITNLLTIYPETLMEKLHKLLPKEGTVLDTNMNYLIYNPPTREQEFRPLLCSHVDTVSRIMPLTSEIITKDGFMRLKPGAMPRCLGGDDRAGIFIMLQLIFSEHRDKYSYAFFNHEEIGGLGSKEFTLSDEFLELDSETSCYISVDRRCEPWKPEIVDYGYDDLELTEFLVDQLTSVTFGMGSFTDCSVLSDASISKLPCFNISAGYVNEHTSKESIHIPTMLMTLDILKELGIPDKQYKHDYKFNDKSWFKNDIMYDNKYVVGGSKGALSLKLVECDYCQAHDCLYETAAGVYLCMDCALEYGYDC